MKSELYRNTGSTTEVKEALLNLSVFAGKHFFSFALFDQNYSTVLEVGLQEINQGNFPGKDAKQAIEFLLGDFRLTTRKYKNVCVSILNSDFSIMPEAFASKEAARDFIGFSSGRTEIKSTGAAVFKEVNFSYTLDEGLQSLFERNFKQAVIRHSGAVSLHMLFANQSLSGCDLFLNFHPQSFEIVAKQDQKFLYYNIFSFESNEDILYYLLFMMEQYGLNPVTVKVRIGGQVAADSELVKTIKKYIRHVDFAVSDKSFKGAFSELKMPDHYFFTLLNQHLCA